MVVCGHRHRPWKWVLDHVPILHAGSFSSERLRGFFSNSYNIIKISDGGYAASLKIIGGARLSFSAIAKGEAGISNLPSAMIRESFQK